MKTEWDYTDLAEAYVKRPDYAKKAIDQMIDYFGLREETDENKIKVCDVGAGAAHLTKVLAGYGFWVDAVEPNDAMRENGIKITSGFKNVLWHEGVGEATGMPGQTYDLVTFGSSFNVCNRQEALLECKRILKPGGGFACMWNHRDLNDPLQKEIEEIFIENIPGYSYGTRREDQTEVINTSGLFEKVNYVEGSVVYSVLADDFIEAWKSHGTVQRQAKEKFDLINAQIKSLVESKKKEYLDVPYTTRIWMARLKD